MRAHRLVLGIFLLCSGSLACSEDSTQKSQDTSGLIDAGDVGIDTHPGTDTNPGVDTTDTQIGTDTHPGIDTTDTQIATDTNPDADATDTSGDGDAADSSIDTAPADTNVSCSSTADCSAGEACHQVQQICVPNDRCIDDGTACDATLPNHPTGYLCGDDGSGADVCIPTCNSNDDCGSGEFCGRDPNGSARFICQPGDCNGFFDTTSCGAGSKCLPLFDGSGFTGTSACVTLDPNPLAEGEPCAALGECELNSMCTPTANGPECVRIDCASTSGNPGCPNAADACIAGPVFQSADIGQCLAFTCEPFAPTIGCASGETCTPSARNPPTGTLIGDCVFAGTTAEGVACADSSECAEGLFCIAQVCRPLCDIESATSGQGACANANDVCVTLRGGNGNELEFGACLPNECEVFGALNCNAGDVCTMILQRNASGNIMGQCEPDGGGVVGSACTAAADCASGLCLGSTCEEPCDTLVSSGPGTCSDPNAVCDPIVLASGPSDFGTCQVFCDPFVAAGGASGCPTGQKCFPDFDDTTRGQCTPAGAGGPGAACTSEADCADGNLCVGSACTAICDFLATGTEPGTCATGETCVAFQAGGEPINLGTCLEDCTAGDPGDACNNSGEFCFDRLLSPAPPQSDYCVAGAPSSVTCSAATQNQLCDDGLAACLDVAGITTGVECLELCLEENGSFLELGHPDCSDPNAICDPSNAEGIGLCNAAF